MSQGGRIYFVWGAALAVAIAGILVEDGTSVSDGFLVCSVGPLFKHDDLKSSKLNSGNAFEVIVIIVLHELLREF